MLMIVYHFTDVPGIPQPSVFIAIQDDFRTTLDTELARHIVSLYSLVIVNLNEDTEYVLFIIIIFIHTGNSDIPLPSVFIAI